MKPHHFINKNSQIIIVTALACEARPLIDYFRLKKVEHIHAFSLYRNAESNLTLIISGVGMLNVASATAFAAAFCEKKLPILFLNIGIAGGFDVLIGDLYLINKVSNEAGKSIYPMALSSFPLTGYALITVDHPCQASEGNLIDMEGYAFYQSASRFTTLELIHSLKIVSDNQYQNFTEIDKHLVKQLIERHMEAIENFLMRLIRLIAEETMEEEQSHKLFQQLCEKFHLTQYQQYEAKALIKKMVAFGLIVDFELFFQKGRSVKCWIDAAKKQIHEFSLGVF